MPSPIDETPAQRVAYGPGLKRAAKAAAVVAAVGGVVELVVGPHRITSVVFLLVGTGMGAIVGRSLARTLREWADDAAQVTETERAALGNAHASPYAIVALAIAGVTAVVVPVLYNVPTPLPGGLAALAVQAWLQARAVDDVEARRQGIVMRPVRRLSFSGEELRLLPHPADES